MQGEMPVYERWEIITPVTWKAKTHMIEVYDADSDALLSDTLILCSVL